MGVYLSYGLNGVVVFDFDMYDGLVVGVKFFGECGNVYFVC